MQIERAHPVPSTMDGERPTGQHHHEMLDHLGQEDPTEASRGAWGNPAHVESLGNETGSQLLHLHVEAGR